MSLDFSSPADTLAEAFRSIIRQRMDEPNKADRMKQLAFATKNTRYWKGDQFLSVDVHSDSWSFDWKSERLPNGAPPPVAWNIIKSDGMKFAAVMSQGTPGLNAVSDEADNAIKQDVARRAQRRAQHAALRWKMRLLMRKMGIYQWRSGPVYLYTYLTEDGERFGYHSREEVTTQTIEMTPAGYECPTCGGRNELPYCDTCDRVLPAEAFQEPVTADVPASVKVVKTPRKGADIQVFDTLSVSHDGSIETLEQATWLNLDQIWERVKAEEKWPHCKGAQASAANWQGDTIGDAGFRAIEQVMYPSGETNSSRKERCRVSTRWLLPVWYSALEPQWEKEARTRFPKGVRVITVEGRVVEMSAERLQDHWRGISPGTDIALASDAICQVAMRIQDALNDFYALAREVLARSTPRTVADRSLMDPKQLKEAGAMVNEIIFTTQGGVGDMSKMLTQLPTSRFSDQLVPFGEMMRRAAQEYTGIDPALFGGGAPANTYRQEAQRKQMAMMQVLPCYQELVAGMADILTLAVRLEMEADQDAEPDDRNGWHIQVDDQYPLTKSEQTARLEELLNQNNPAIVQALGLLTPSATGTIVENFKIEGLSSGPDNLRRKNLSIIARLLDEEPVADEAGGMMPSIQPDPFTESDYGLQAALTRDWCNSDEGMKMEREKPKGYDNVKAYGYYCEMEAQNQMALQQASAGQPPDLPPDTQPAPVAEPPMPEPEGVLA